MITSRRYRILQKHYGTKEGIEAIVFYVLAVALMILQAYLFTLHIDVSMLPWIQIAFAILEIIVVLVAVKVSKQKLKTIGVTRRIRSRSVVWGITGAFLLTCFVIVSRLVSSNGKLGFQEISFVVAALFVLSGISDEIVFRGYIETRLSGLVKNRSLCSCIVGAMFLAIYFPVRWFATVSYSFTMLTGVYMICLVALHFSCDYIYRKTNCIYGSMILHVIYNIGAFTLVVA